MTTKFLTLLLLTVGLLACGCMSKHDAMSEDFASKNWEGQKIDLNNGLSEAETEAIIVAAYAIARPALPADAPPEAVEARKVNLIEFTMKVQELLLYPISVEIALARAGAWLRYEQSKRDPKKGDLPRLDERIRDSDGEFVGSESD